MVPVMVPVVSCADPAAQVTARSSIISPSLRMLDPLVRCSLSPAQFVLHASDVLPFFDAEILQYPFRALKG